MSQRATCRFVSPLCLAVLAFACVTPEGSYRLVSLETTKPTRISGDDRSVAVTVVENDTIVEIGRSVFSFRDYRGYLGRIGSRAGHVSVGRATLTWKDDSVTLRSPGNWSTHRPSSAGNIYVCQDGRMGRSVFRR